MTPDAGKLAAVADLPSFTVEVGELDLVELAQRGLVGPELRLTAAAQARLGEVGTFVVRDVEATPLLLAERHGAQVRTSPLRPVESILSEPEPAELTVVVHSLPSAQELAELSTRAGWGTRVTWLVLAGRTQAGRRLLHEVTDFGARRARHPSGRSGSLAEPERDGTFRTAAAARPGGAGRQLRRARGGRGRNSAESRGRVQRTGRSGALLHRPVRLW